MVCRSSFSGPPAFFPEADDDPAARATYSLENTKANELLYRRLDIADAVDAHLLGSEKAPQIGFARYVVSATSPFDQDQLAMLRRDAASVVRRLFSDCEHLYAARGWRLPDEIDRVYVNDRARSDLGWRPQFDFAHVLSCLRAKKDFRSELARQVGAKGYHDAVFEDGPYPVIS